MNWRKEVDGFKAALAPVSPGLASSYIRFGFFGLVGGGKSVTAGLLALSITPPDSLIVWVDGEGRRSSYAIDQLAGMASKHYGRPKQSFIDRFKVFHVDPPFNPLVAVAAMEKAEEMGAKAVILDLMSQCWDSEGGYLDMREEEINRMAGEDDSKRNRVSASAAAHIKPWTHGKLAAKINSCKAHVILVFQAKAKWDAKNKQVQEFVSPIQESGITRTALAVGYVSANEAGLGGFCNFQLARAGAKYTHPDLLACLPGMGEQFSFGHGEAVMRWCSGGAAVVPSEPGTSGLQTKKERNDLVRELVRLTEPKHRGDMNVLQQWCRDEGVVSDTEVLAELTVERLRAVLGVARDKMRVAA